VLQVVDLDRGGFSMHLGGRGRTTLFIVATEWHGTDRMGDEARTGQGLTAEVPASDAGWP